MREDIEDRLNEKSICDRQQMKRRPHCDIGKEGDAPPGDQPPHVLRCGHPAIPSTRSSMMPSCSAALFRSAEYCDCLSLASASRGPNSTMRPPSRIMIL